MKMLCTRWVLDLLSIDQKLIRMLVSQACLDRFKQNKKDFARRFLTAYETWIHHYTSEQKKKHRRNISVASAGYGINFLGLQKNFDNHLFLER